MAVHPEQDAERYSEVSPRLADKLLEHGGVPLQLTERRVLYQAGEPAKQLYVVIAGKIITQRIPPVEKSSSGNFIDSVAGPGYVIGVEAMEQNQRRDSTAVALQPSEVIQIPEENIFNVFAAVPELQLALIKQLTRQEDKLAVTTRGTSGQRTIQAVYDLYDLRDLPPNFKEATNMRITRIAQSAGMTPETVQKAIYRRLSRKRAG